MFNMCEASLRMSALLLRALVDMDFVLLDPQSNLVFNLCRSLFWIVCGACLHATHADVYTHRHENFFTSEREDTEKRRGEKDEELR